MKTRIHVESELLYGNIVITSYTSPGGSVHSVDRSFYGGTAMVDGERVRRFELTTGATRHFLYLDDAGRWFVLRP